jgi:hypothetical protein
VQKTNTNKQNYNCKTALQTGEKTGCSGRVFVPWPIKGTYYDFEKPVKETKIPNRKHYEQ